MSREYAQSRQQSRILANRMRCGTGAASLLQAQNAPTHHIDALDRFQKDFAVAQRQKRQQQLLKRQQQIQKKRIQMMQRQNLRWMRQEQYQKRLKQRQLFNYQKLRLGLKKSVNSNGLAYNPITLQYDKNPQGQRLKKRDEDTKIRGFVRSHNMDNYGNSKYNPLTGQKRIGIQRIIPEQLNNRFQRKKQQHYQQIRLRLPSEGSYNLPYIKTHEVHR